MTLIMNPTLNLSLIMTPTLTLVLTHEYETTLTMILILTHQFCRERIVSFPPSWWNTCFWWEIHQNVVEFFLVGNPPKIMPKNTF